MVTHQNGSIALYPNTKEFNAKRYVGRVNWAGDVSEQRATFELSNIQDRDKEDYGVEVRCK